MECFQVRYDSRVIIYKRKLFIRLATSVVIAGSNPSHRYWMDIFVIIYCFKILLLFEKTENKRKEAGLAHF